MDVRADRANPRGNPPRGETVWPRHLSEPAGNHHGRADDGCLHVGGHARLVQPLVVRQAFSVYREKLQAGPDGPGLRDRHQLEPVHRLSNGGKQPDHAVAGDRACGLRPQFLLQGQLPVPRLDGCGRHHRLYGVCQELHRRMRTAPWRRRRGIAARLLPRHPELWRGPLQAPGETVDGEGICAPERARGLCAVADQSVVAHPAPAR